MIFLYVLVYILGIIVMTYWIVNRVYKTKGILLTDDIGAAWLMGLFWPVFIMVILLIVIAGNLAKLTKERGYGSNKPR